jgi:ribosomal protein S19
MSRSAWKPLFIHPQFREQALNNEINMQNRSTAITKQIIGRTLNIYNGNIWYTVQVSDERKGQCIGQFAPTRHQPTYKKKSKK